MNNYFEKKINITMCIYDRYINYCNEMTLIFYNKLYGYDAILLYFIIIIL